MHHMILLHAHSLYIGYFLVSHVRASQSFPYYLQAVSIVPAIPVLTALYVEKILTLERDSAKASCSTARLEKDSCNGEEAENIWKVRSCKKDPSGSISSLRG